MDFCFFTSLIVATQLGRAALLSSLPTGDALTVLADLHQAMKGVALDTELHLIYLVTCCSTKMICLIKLPCPIFYQVTPLFCYNEWTGLDWYQYLNIYESLSSAHKNAANLVGISEQFLMQMASGASNTVKRGRKSERIQRILGTHRRYLYNI